MTKQFTKRDWIIPALLVLFSLVPTLGGIVRLMSMSGKAAIAPENARFIAAPIPIITHLLAATLFSLLGAFQFSRGFRVRWPGVHRRAGRILVVCGLLAGLTGLWMTAVYPIPTPMQGPLLRIVRLVVGVAMVASIAIAVSSVLRRNIKRHEAFMIRAYAIGQGAGTQALILGPWMLLTGQSVGLTRDLLMSLSWAINIAVAELIIRARAPQLSPRHARPGASPLGTTSGRLSTTS